MTYLFYYYIRAIIFRFGITDRTCGVSSKLDPKWDYNRRFNYLYQILYLSQPDVGETGRPTGIVSRFFERFFAGSRSNPEAIHGLR